MESPTAPEQFREKFKTLSKVSAQITRQKRQHNYDINVIKRYFGLINGRREIENIPPKELNIQLAKFFMNVRKKNGDVYEPTSLKDFQRSLQRY